MRELKETKQKKTGECGPCHVSRWPFFETMMFCLTVSVAESKEFVYIYHIVGYSFGIKIS